MELPRNIGDFSVRKRDGKPAYVEKPFSFLIDEHTFRFLFRGKNVEKIPQELPNGVGIYRKLLTKEFAKLPTDTKALKECVGGQPVKAS